MNLNPTGSVLVLVFLIVFRGCDASLLSKIRKLSTGIDPKNNNVPQEISPSVSPSPAPGIDSLTNGGIMSNSESHTKNVQAPYTSPAPSPAGPESQITVTCTGSSESCHYQNDINMTACLYPSSNANKEMFLLIQNDGESFLEVNVTILNVQNTSQEINVTKHHVEKVNVSDGGSPSILLNAGNGKCIIHLGSSKPNNLFMNLPPYASHVTPTHGAYVLFLAALVIGGTWAICKLRKKGPQVDGIAYQELEMAQPDSPRANHAGTTDGWDEGWDDNWDDIETVKSPSAHQNGNASLNGHTSGSSDKDGW